MLNKLISLYGCKQKLEKGIELTPEELEVFNRDSKRYSEICSLIDMKECIFKMFNGEELQPEVFTLYVEASNLLCCTPEEWIDETPEEKAENDRISEALRKNTENVN